MNTFSAIAIQNTSAPQRVSGILTVDSHAIHFEGGGQTYTFKAEELQVLLGGPQDRLIFFRSALQPEVHFYTDDERVLQQALFYNYPSLIKTNQQSSSPYAKAFILVLIGGLILIGLVVGLFFFFKDRLIEQAAKKVPFAWEEKLGEQMFAMVTTGHDLIDNDSLVLRLGEAIQPLLDVAKQEGFTPDIHLSINEEINAFALPGGKVVINSGLIEHAQDWEEVSGVMAHELAHVMRRHHVRSTLNEVGLSVLFSTLLGDLGGLSQTGSNLAGLSNSRKFETEADETGWSLLTKADIDPAGLIRFFELLKKEYGSPGSTPLNFLSTHPDVDKRISNLKQKLAQGDGNYTYLPNTFDEFQKDLAEIIKR